MSPPSSRFISTDMRGSAIKRSQNQRRKLDGITSYFDHTMESLPPMLQVGLLLLGFALSPLPLGLNITVISVVLAVALFGVIFYVLSPLWGRLLRAVHAKTRVPAPNVIPSLPSSHLSFIQFTVAHELFVFVPSTLCDLTRGPSAVICSSNGDHQQTIPLPPPASLFGYPLY